MDQWAEQQAGGMQYPYGQMQGQQMQAAAYQQQMQQYQMQQQMQQQAYAQQMQMAQAYQQMTPQQQQQFVAYQQQQQQMQQQMLQQKQQQMQAALPPQAAPSVASPQHAPQATPSGSTAHVGVFLEEIEYFLEDMKVSLWWLLYLAHQDGGPPSVVCGDESVKPEETERSVQDAIERMRMRAETHSDEHPTQVRAKITIVPSVTKEERGILNKLRELRFHCKGRIEVFDVMKEANNSAIWAAYFNAVQKQEPQWMLKSDGPGSKPLFTQCVIVVPVYVDRAKQELKLFNVWCPDKKKKHWAFPGGNILRGADACIYDAARREFHEEVGVFFGLTWRDCFVAELPTTMVEPQHESICLYNQYEKEGVRYPCRPHILAEVTEDFYSTTRHYEDASGVIHLPNPTGERFVRWDDLANAQKVHREGVRFLEHDEARWVSVDFASGQITADDGRPLRKENADLIKLQPEKIWEYFARLTGRDPIQRHSTLPSGFPEDGPFAVRMSGIDKQATDDDIIAYFQDNGVPVKSAEQFDVPRHTARIEFHDRMALENALQLSGRNLCRRKVRVELWTDGDVVQSVVPGARPLKPYEGPLPEEGPFRVFVRGLDKSVTRDELGYFFWDRECQVKDVDYPLKNERHAGVVEFQSQESLRSALGLNRAVFKGREICIELPGPKEHISSSNGGRSSAPRGGKGGRGGERSSGGYGGDRGDGGGHGGGGGGGGGRDRSEREPPSRAEFGSERPRLELKPRSKPLPGEPGYREPVAGFEDAGAQRPQGAKPSPFGDARPRDDRFKHTRADDDTNWRR